MSELPQDVAFAGPGHIERIAQLDPAPSQADWVRKIQAREVIVAIDGGQIAGVLRFEFLWTTLPFLSRIFLCAQARGKGLSRRMLALLRTHLQAMGHTVLLSSSQTNEPEPQAWHRHMGFTETGLLANIDEEGTGELFFRLKL